MTPHEALAEKIAEACIDHDDNGCTVYKEGAAAELIRKHTEESVRLALGEMLSRVHLTADGRVVRKPMKAWKVLRGKLQSGQVMCVADIGGCYFDISVCYSTPESATEHEGN